MSVFSDDATAEAAVVGIYSRMISSSGFASGSTYSITALTGLSSDEFNTYSTDSRRIEFFTNALSASNGAVLTYLWKEPFQYIYTANSILEGLSGSTQITKTTESRLEGEAKFIRAFCNFYLANLFGEIPLIGTTDYKTNAVVTRKDRSVIFKQILQDLDDAKSLLPNDNSFSGGERVRPNRWAATAMLARVSLYIGDWGKAEKYADTVINNTTDFQLLEDTKSVFLANSGEAIWQLKPVGPNINTNEGNLFIINSTPRQYALTKELVSAFETGDKRKDEWVGVFVNGADSFYFPYKYKIKTGGDLTEYSMVLRLAEQYLIRAEARAMLDNIIGAQEDLNTIRNRAGLANTTSNNRADLMMSIEQERRIELFSEWGHRWLDLKRTGRADPLLGLSKAPGWVSMDSLYPVPLSEILLDPNLTQNFGY